MEVSHEPITTVMRQCRLFDGIPEEKYQNVLACLRGETKLFRKDAILLQIGECQKRPGVVMDGTLRISLYSEDGNLVTIERLGRGQVFGETLVCSMAEDSPIQIDALTDVQVLYLDFDPLLLQQECACPHKAQVTANLLREMGRSALFLNQKMRILAQNRLRNRIKLYLQMLPVKPGGELHLDMGRGELADYLCVDRSASPGNWAYAERGDSRLSGPTGAYSGSEFSQRINFACPLPWQRTGFFAGAIISLQ